MNLILFFFLGTGGSELDTCPLPSASILSPITLAKHNVVKYLVKCHKMHREITEKYSAKTSQINPELVEAVNNLQKKTFETLMRTVVLVLTDRIYENLNYALDQSCLLELLYQDQIPDEFLYDLVAEAHKKPADFEQIFGQVLRGLFIGMQRIICATNIITQPIEMLSKLITIKVGNMRPLCDLVAGQINFLPPICTKIGGREIVKCSYLGPFLSISLFAEENVKFAEAHGKLNVLATGSVKLRWVSHKIIDCYKNYF